MKRNPTLPPNFILGYANAAPNLQNYGSQGRRCLDNIQNSDLIFTKLSTTQRSFFPVASCLPTPRE
ncbi:hypothetical protein GNF10_06080 [Nostoc sp. UCD121]|uniref:hypothetical protein n=1 Tax=Nostoc sp. UCD121 TaxID=2681305 RepID=UPI001627827A|nr:hypothetical protein [Nostoc sp. UCD121]MBC1221534.1 hypothetical protein [Nostoc sp. UCD120]MBC1275565.1 hypothetical protein [Nostoc sp. UCD121]MBC1299084.1 hypothetical protein [Nostoc sp. UCD122]